MNSAQTIASQLLAVDAVKFNIKQPFTWASGWKSPVYCDNRKLLSFPYVRDLIKKELSTLITKVAPDTDALAGVATAGIAWSVLAADELRLPCLYVRPKPKEHGMGNQIEGMYTPGQNILVIEDLISTGKSSLQVCEILEKSGVQVSGLVSIFDYGFPQASASFSTAGIPFYSLTTYEILINMAVEKKIVSSEQLNTLLNWRSNPAEWNGI
ncbi:MAG: orotate phosphoribosyltransferase [Ferruginibacter sp.]